MFIGILNDAFKRAVVQHSPPVLMRSGGESSWTFDALRLGDFFRVFMLILKPLYQPVGIELGGALLAQAAESGYAGLIRKPETGGQVYIPTPPEGIWPERTVSLIDDVVTTGKSLEVAQEALWSAGYTIGERLCIVDRSPYHESSRCLITGDDLIQMYRLDQDGQNTN